MRPCPARPLSAATLLILVAGVSFLLPEAGASCHPVEKNCEFTGGLDGASLGTEAGYQVNGVVVYVAVTLENGTVTADASVTAKPEDPVNLTFTLWKSESMNAEPAENETGSGNESAQDAAVNATANVTIRIEDGAPGLERKGDAERVAVFNPNGTLPHVESFEFTVAPCPPAGATRIPFTLSAHNETVDGIAELHLEGSPDPGCTLPVPVGLGTVGLVAAVAVGYALGRRRG